MTAELVALRELVEAYAQGADLRRPDAVAELFAPDGELALWLEPVAPPGNTPPGNTPPGNTPPGNTPPGNTPVGGGEAAPVTRRGRTEIASALAGLERYRATTHVIASHRATVDPDDPDRASAITTTVAHHAQDAPGASPLEMLGITYHDTFTRDRDGRWRFARRELRVQWRWGAPVLEAASRPGGTA